jgi:hypothetical protein
VVRSPCARISHVSTHERSYKCRNHWKSAQKPHKIDELPEKDDMNSPKRDGYAVLRERTFNPTHHSQGIDLQTLNPQQKRHPMHSPTPTSIAPETRVDRLLRCVSSGYLSDGCSCQATVPESVVRAAWARELRGAPAREDQFFRFAWHEGEWRAYGLRDGRVRGVYCPEHSVRQGERPFEYNVGVRAAAGA